MAQQKYPISLRYSTFPLLSELLPRTVIGTVMGRPPSDGDSPGIAYCHNVMPTKEGIKSVGFLSMLSASNLDLVDVRVIYGDEYTRIYLGFSSTGKIYSLLPGDTSWNPIPDPVPSIESTHFSADYITIGRVNGISYIFYKKLGCFTYDEDTNTLAPVTLQGLTVTEILGITASSGYLIAYTSVTIAWSSTIDPTDFIPSTATGAGGGNVSGTNGAIRYVTANSLGLLIYTDTNTVAGTFTGNAQYPFKFRPIDDGNGAIALSLLGYEAESSKQFVYSTAGLQMVTSQRADVILPEVTDFLAGRKFEDFDESSLSYTYTVISSGNTMKKRLNYIASRYLVISYGVTEYTHALIYDTALEKLGKVKITHVDAIEYTRSQSEISKEALGFVTSGGSISVVDFSDSNTGIGVLILGKLQATLTRLLTLQEVTLDNLYADGEFSLTDLVTFDGKTISNVSFPVSYSADTVRTFSNCYTALTHSIVLKGKFNLVDALVTYTLAGRR